MTVVCEIAFALTDGASSTAAAARLGQTGACLPALIWLDLYAPAAGVSRDPYVQDGPAPAHLAILGFASLAVLDQAAASAVFAGLLSGLSVITCTAMRHVAFPVSGESTPALLTARFCYVVRYHRPADDEAAFVQHYLDGHPPLLGRLPGIRNIMCYLPLPWRRTGGPPPADYLIGNEVVFADATAFDAAMASPIRQELRSQYRTLPHSSGRNTHQVMERSRLIG